MIKKIILILFVFVLSSCSVNKKNLYHLTVDDEEVIVGYSKLDNLFTSFDECKIDDKGVITSIVIYPKDYDNQIMINNIELSNSIEENALLFEGEMIDEICAIEKKVSGKINRIIIYNNILNDNLDEVDHLVISYE